MALEDQVDDDLDFDYSDPGDTGADDTDTAYQIAQLERQRPPRAGAPPSMPKAPVTFGLDDPIAGSTEAPRSSQTQRAPSKSATPKEVTFGLDDPFTDQPEASIPLPRARPREAPAPVPQAFDPFGIDKPPNLRPDLAAPASQRPYVFGEEPSFGDQPATEEARARAGLTPEQLAPYEKGRQTEAPFRTGGAVYDTALGSKTGMLSGEEAYEKQKQDIKSLEAAAKAARERADKAKSAYDEAVGKLKGGAQDASLIRGLQQKYRPELRQHEAEEAERTAAHARVSPATQSAWRNILERAPGSAAGMLTSTVAGTARLGAGITELSDFLIAKALGTKPHSELFARDNKAIDDAAATINKHASQILFQSDPARDKELGTQLVDGVVSTVIFAAGGAAAKAVNLSVPAVVAILGALPQAEQQYQQAAKAINLQPGYAKEWLKGYGIDVDESAANNIVRWTMFAGGLGIGATEAVPVAHMFERLEKATKGRFTQYLGIIAAQAGEEGVQNAGQQLAQNAMTRGLLDPKAELTDEVWENFVVGALSGAMVTGVVGAPQAFSRQVNDIRAYAGLPPLDVEGWARQFGEGEHLPLTATPTAGAPVQEARVGIGSPGRTAPPAGVVPPPQMPEPLPEQQAPEPEPEPEAQPPPQEPAPVEQEEVLRRYGYTDEQIAEMSPAQRQAEYDDAIASGIHVAPDESVAPVPTEPPRQPLQSQIGVVTDTHRQAIAEATSRIGGWPKEISDLTDIDELAAQAHAAGETPDDAVQLALAKAALDHGVLTPETAREAYGNDILEKIAAVFPAKPAPERPVSAAPRGAPATGPTGQTAKAEELAQGVPPSGQAGAPPVAAGAGVQSEAPAAGYPAARTPEGARPAPAGAASGGKPAAPAEKRARREAIPKRAAEPERPDNAAEAPLIGQKATGIAEHTVTDAAGTKIKVAPVVVEAGSLITSADKGYDQSLQPRDRDRAASQAQIREIATRLDPERLGYSAEADRGAPIVGPTGMVESGNGRVLALRKVYSANPKHAEAYKKWLTSQGVDVSKYKQPILVRQRVSAMKPGELRAFTVAANQPTTLVMAAPERAQADARYLTPHMLDLIEDGSDLRAASNRKFVQAFVKALPVGERGALATAEGALSTEGLSRAKNAILARAYGDPDIIARITESSDDDIKSISAALVAAAPQWAKFRSAVDAGTVAPEFDATKDLVEAVKRTADLRAKGIKLAEYLAQQDAFDQIKDDVLFWMQSFYNPQGTRAAGVKRIVFDLQTYAEQAGRVTTDPRLDLGAEEVTPREIQQATKAKGEKEFGASREGADKGARGEGVGPEIPKPGAGKGGRKDVEGGERRTGGRAILREPERRFGAEPGAEGKPQLVIPGTERVSDAELAKRRAGERLKPRAPQKAPGGLFEIEGKQEDIFDAATKTADAFPDKVAKPIAPPQIKEKAKPQQTSLFDWEQPDERTRTKGPGTKALGGMAPGEGGRVEEGGKVRGGATSGGQPRPGRDRAPDAGGLFGPRGERGGAPAVHPPPAGEPGVGRAGAGVGGVGGGVSAGVRGAAGARGPGRAPLPEVKPEQRPNVPAVNYRITDETQLGMGSEGVKYRDNIAAIETLKKIESENRRPTPQEQRILARYVGWGGLASAFPDAEGKFKPDWEERGKQLVNLLTKEEHAAARHSTPNAHYTSRAVIDAMWRLAQRLGFKGGLALENSMGTGNFLGLVPEEIAGQTRFIGVELDSISARIAKALYPQETVLQSGFQRVPLPDGEFILSIGNPPFGSESLRFAHKPDLQGLSIHNQFFLASLEALRPNGLHLAVVSRFLLDAQSKNAREKMAIKADLIGAVRLPDTAFKENARTEVVTDIVAMQRRTPESERRMQELYNRMYQGGRSKEADEARTTARREFEHAAPWVETGEISDPLGGAPMVVNQHFVSNPKMVLGRLERSGTMRGKEEVNVKLDQPERLPEMLNAAVDKFGGNKLDLDKEIIDRTLERYKTLADSLKIAMQGLEPGHLEHNEKGELTQISERETPSGDFEPIRRVLTPDTPWSRQLTQDPQGRWYVQEPKLGPKGEKIRERGTRLVYERKYFPNNEVPAGMRLGEQRLARLHRLAKMRDLLKRQIVLETEDADPKVMERNRSLLAAAYRSYTDKEGLLNDPRNMQLLNEMPDGPLLMSLESGYKPAISQAKASRTGIKARAASAKPATILSQRVVPKYEPPTKADTPADAIAISLSERGRLDMSRIAGLLGVDETRAGEMLSEGDNPLAFFDPETKTWEPRAYYLSGQVRRKLAAARLGGLDKNVAALEKVQPERWTPDQITPFLGSNWVPAKTYEEFVKHLLGAEMARVTYSEVTNAYGMITGDYGAAKQAEWGTPDMPADAIIRGMLRQKLPKVMREERTPVGTHRYEDKNASALVVLKSREIGDAFQDWVFSDPERRRALVDVYNDKFNTTMPRQHDGSHLTMPGKNPAIVLRRHVKNAIWRGIYSLRMLVDHVVGAGKTFTAIGRIMERRRMGLTKKAVVVVPNHLVEQWASEAHTLYPGIKLLAAGNNQFDKKNRRRLFARIATGDYDLIIVPHSSFEFIGISPETEIRFLEEQLRIANKAVEDAWAESEGGGRFKPYTVKEAERLVSKIESRMDALRSGRRDRMLTFEQMGIDDLTVDEAHEFKNLFYNSRMTGVRGMGTRTGSQKAFDLYNKIKVLDETPGASVTFLTGTPISNSAVEMYTMMRYLAPQQLRELGLEHFDAWRQQYVSAEPDWEPTETGGLKEVTRLGRSWSNMRALMNLYHSFTDSVTQDDINRWYREDNNGEEFPIPKLATGDRITHKTKPTGEQQRILREIIDGFDNLEDIEDPDQRNAERLRLMDRARKISLDVRAIEPRSTSKEEGGKLEALSDEVARIYKKWSSDRGTQAIFLDRSVPKSRSDAPRIKEYDELVAKRDDAVARNDEEAFRRVADSLDKFDPNEMEELRRAQAGGWNAYQQIKDNLIARGIPAEEVRFIQEANTDAEKKLLIDAVNSGEVRVIIGSTPRLGAGTNMQERIVAGHHADVGWRSSDIEQREGRWIRQGNKLLEKYGKSFEVETHTYVTENTIDQKMWDINAQKLRMINGVRKYDGSFTMDFADEAAVSMAEIAALASGDPLLMDRVKLTGEIEKLEMQERAFRRKMVGIEDAISDAQRAIRDFPERIKETEAAASDMLARIRGLKESVAKRRVTVEGKPYSNDFDAFRAAEERVAEIRKEAGKETARYELTIDGNKVTSKDTIEAAIYGALGDKEPFEAKIEGETIRRRSTAAKMILDKIIDAVRAVAPQEEKAVKVGRMLDADLVALISGVSGDNSEVALSLFQNGKTLAATRHVTVSRGLAVDAQGMRSALYALDRDVNDVATSTGQWMQQRIDAARKALPELQPQLNQTSPYADKLAAARDKLRDVIQTLDTRTRGQLVYGGVTWNTGALTEYITERGWFEEPSAPFQARARIARVIDSVPESDLTSAIKRRDKSLSPISNKEEVVDSLVRDLQEVRARPTTAAIMDTPERLALQHKIADWLYEHHGHAYPTAKQQETVRQYNRRVDIVLGPSAAGKSTVAVEPLLETHGGVLIDSDEAKRLLPEFDNGFGAGVVHDESSRIAENLLLKRAHGDGANIVFPLVGKTLPKIERLITLFKEGGYDVHLHLVDLPIERAVERAMLRYVSHGRLLDPDYVTSIDHLPQAVFAKVKERPDVSSHHVIDTNVPFGTPPILRESRGEASAYSGLGRARVEQRDKDVGGDYKTPPPAEERGVGGFADAGPRPGPLPFEDLPAQVRGLVERIPGEDGMEVLIVRNSDNVTFNAVLRDADAQQTVSSLVKLPSIERARAKAREMLEGRTGPLAFEKTAPRGWREVEAGPVRPTMNTTELGRFHHTPSTPIGRDAQDYVLARGREHNIEYVVLVNGKGKVVFNGYGDRSSTGASDKMIGMLIDPAQSLVVHHNHPSGRPLSQTDISVLVGPGLHSVWAHGHDGIVTRASLTDAARGHLGRSGGDAWAPWRQFDLQRASLLRITNAAYDEFLSPLDRLVFNGVISDERANILWAELGLQALARAGIIDYQSNVDVSGLGAWVGPYLHRAATNAEGSFFHGRRKTAGFGAARSAGALRHPGDVGATFDPTTRAVPDRVPRRSDRGGRAITRTETQGQIRLPGFAATAPRPRLTVPPLAPLHESVRAAINDPTMSRSQRLSAAIDALALTPSRALWDKIIDLSRFQRAAELATGQATPENLDSYLAATLYPGKVGERVKDVTRHLFEPLYDEMAKRDVSRADLNEFLYARHAPERNAQIRSIDPANDAGSGITDAEAAATMARLAPQRANLDAVAARVDAIVAHNRTVIESEGLEHPKTILLWKNAYQHYVPLKGAESSEDEHGSPPRGTGFSTRGPESKRALGRFSRAGDILANLLDQSQRTIVRAEKNRVGKTFMRFAQRNPSRLYKIGLGEMRRRVNPQTGLVENQWVTAGPLRDNAFAVKVAGKTYYIEIEHEGLLLALKNVGMDRLNPFMRAIAAFTRQYSAFQTARNPEFVLTNFIRDLQDAGLSLTSEQKARFLLAFTKNIGNGRAFLAAVMGEMGKTTGRHAALYDEWRLAGGKISMFGYKDLHQIFQDTERELQLRTESTTKKVAMAPLRALNPFSGPVVKLFEALSDVTESTTRLAVYAAAREIGLTKAEAARAARQMTVDFNAQGKYGPWLKALYAFSGPQIQGTLMLVRRIRKSPRMAFIAGAAIPSLAFGLTLWNMWAAGDDPEDKQNLYAKRKYWEREKNILVYFPGMKDALKLPLGYMLQPFWMMGENIAMAAMGKITPLEAFGNWVGTTAKSFNPLGGEGSALSLGFWLQAITPTIAEPLAELVRNRNWLNRPIHPEEMPWTKGKPHSEQSKVATSPIAESVAQWLNKISGGNAFRKGLVDPYPDDLEYAWNFALGGFGKFLLNSWGVATDVVQGVDTPVEKLPFVRRFVAPGESLDTERSDYYEKSHEAKEQTAALKDAMTAVKQGHDVEAATQVIRELTPKVGVYEGPRGGTRYHTEELFKEANKQLQALRLRERNIRRDPNVSRADRARLIKENRDQQQLIMRNARRTYREMQPAAP